MNRLSALLLSASIAVVAAICGCDGARDSDAPAAKKARHTISFEVDGAGVSYLYRHPQRGLHSAEDLEDVPLEYRAAVIVATRKREAPDFDARRYFVANLLGARPGGTATAVSVTKKTFVRRNLAASRGHQRAERVRFWAQELAQLAPNSERARSSDRALRLLEETPAPESPPSPKSENAP